jgi:hypothetical protein
MTGPILITALGIVVLAIGIHALAKGSFGSGFFSVKTLKFIGAG